MRATAGPGDGLAGCSHYLFKSCSLASGQETPSEMERSSTVQSLLAFYFFYPAQKRIRSSRCPDH